MNSEQQFADLLISNCLKVNLLGTIHFACVSWWAWNSERCASTPFCLLGYQLLPPPGYAHLILLANIHPTQLHLCGWGSCCLVPKGCCPSSEDMRFRVLQTHYLQILLIKCPEFVSLWHLVRSLVHGNLPYQFRHWEYAWMMPLWASPWGLPLFERVSGIWYAMVLLKAWKQVSAGKLK